MQLANSADVKLIFPINRILHSMKIVSLHEVSDPIFYENKKKYFKIKSAKIFTSHEKYWGTWIT